MTVHRAIAPHYTWGKGCDGWRLVQADSLSIIEERMLPGASEASHYHRTARQFFHVLRGILSIEVDGRQHSVAAGQGLEIPPGQPHCVRNDGSSQAEFLVISHPPTANDRVEAPPAGQ